MSEGFFAPGQQRFLRACMVCSIVLSQTVGHPRFPRRPYRFRSRKLTQDLFSDTQKFRDIGCPNCEDILHLAGSQEQIESCTSQVFEGLITLADPARSWVAKWQRLDGYVKGVYATKVSGTLPDEVRQMLEDEGRVYIP